MIGCAITLILGGCALKRPRISVEDLRIEEIGQSGARLALDLELANPSDVPIRLEEWDWTIRFDRERGPSITPVDQALTDTVRRVLDPRRPSWRGRWQALRTLPPESTVRVTLPAAIETVDGELIARLRDGSALPWIVDGTVSFSSDQRIARILFDAELYRPSEAFAGTGESVDRSATLTIAPFTVAPAGTVDAPSMPRDLPPVDPGSNESVPGDVVEVTGDAPTPGG